jgi:hypothetical protein
LGTGGWGKGMKPRKSFLLRISPELYEALEAWAQQEFRSVNGQIEYVLKEAVRRHGRALPEDETPPGREPPPGSPVPP